MRIAGSVVAGAAIEQVIADSTEQQVIARIAMQRVVAGACGEDVIAVTGIDDVVTVARHQCVVARRTGEGVAVLVADGHVGIVAAAMVVAGGVAAVIVRRGVVGAGIIELHGQLIAFRVACTAAATDVGNVGDMNLVNAIGVRRDGLAIGEGNPGAAVDGVLHGDMAGGQVVVQIEGFALLEVDGDAVLIVGIGGGDRAQVTTDHQQGGHRCGGGREGAAHIAQALVARFDAAAGEVDRTGADEVRSLGNPAGIEGGWRSLERVAVGVGVVGQQQLARHRHAVRQHVGDDVVIGGHRCRVRNDLDHQRRVGEIAVVVADGETNVFGEHHRRGFLRHVVVFASVEVHHQRAFVVGGDAQGVVGGVEGAVVGTTAEVQRTLVVVAFRIVGVRGAIDGDGFDEAAIRPERTALAQQRTGHWCADHGAREHRVELAEVGDDHRVGIGARAGAVVGQWIEGIVVDVFTQADRVVLDLIVGEEVFPVRLILSADRAFVRFAVGEEVADVLCARQFAVGVERILRHVDRRVVVGTAARRQAGNDRLGSRHVHPD
ncbi:hypothetical protein D3C71_1075940 [compost metagenome]